MAWVETKGSSGSRGLSRLALQRLPSPCCWYVSLNGIAYALIAIPWAAKSALSVFGST